MGLKPPTAPDVSMNVPLLLQTKGFFLPCFHDSVTFLCFSFISFHLSNSLPHCVFIAAREPETLRPGRGFLSWYDAFFGTVKLKYLGSFWNIYNVPWITSWKRQDGYCQQYSLFCLWPWYFLAFLRIKASTLSASITNMILWLLKFAKVW